MYIVAIVSFLLTILSTISLTINDALVIYIFYYYNRKSARLVSIGDRMMGLSANQSTSSFWLKYISLPNEYDITHLKEYF